MNEVAVSFSDSKHRQAAIVVNGVVVPVGFVEKIAKNGFDTNTWLSVRLCVIHNQSNPLTFEAATMPVLMKKVANYPINY